MSLSRAKTAKKCTKKCAARARLLCCLLTLGRTSKFGPPPWYKEWGWLEPLSGVCDMLQYFETMFSLVESLWPSYQDEVYFMGGDAAGGLWRHQKWSPSWILPRIGNQVKTARNGKFLCFTWKITHKCTLFMISASRFIFIVERSWKNMYFHPKLAWPPATYDVISRNHSNWTSLNSSQNLGEGWTNSHWKRQEQMFYPLGKNS